MPERKDVMKLLFLYWGIMILCYIAASRLDSRKDSFGFIGGALNAVIYILVFIMGLRIGANKEVQDFHILCCQGNYREHALDKDIHRRTLHILHEA